MFLIQISMSYDEAVESSKELDEKHRELTLKFDKKMRKKIGYVREKYRRDAYNRCVKFFALHFATPDAVTDIQQVVQEADREMKKIHKDLYANVIIIPLSLSEIKKKGELYEQIYYAICLQMGEAIYQHIDKLKSTIPSARTRKTLEDMMRHFKALNVIGDKRIEKKITELEKIITKSVPEMKQQILDDMEFMRRELQAMMTV